MVLSIHGRSLVNKSVIELLKLHDFVSHIDGAPLNPAHTLELVRALTELNLGACSINIAALPRHTTRRAPRAVHVAARAAGFLVEPPG